MSRRFSTRRKSGEFPEFTPSTPTRKTRGATWDEPGAREGTTTPQMPCGRAVPSAVGVEPLAVGGGSSSSSSAAVRVVARVRPRVPQEMQEKESVKTSTDRKTLSVTDGRVTKAFAVDEVFDSRAGDCGQKQIFEAFGRDLVAHSLQGYNICLLAYGHTGSGKTYTMFGDGADFIPEVHGDGAGLLPRFIHEVFASHSVQGVQAENTIRYSCQYFEVYNEQIRDLLMPNKAASAERTRKVHVHPKHGVRVDGLTVSMVAEADQALGLLTFGNQMRAVASTTMNSRSSRSHAIFNFKFESIDATSGPGRRDHSESTVLFVDLAGREDHTASRYQATTMREMCHINTSLFHLAHLIQKLSEGQIEQGKLTDFRNSKLTLVLSQAFMGNSRTAVVATVSPSLSLFEDSVLTLSFAQSVKKVQTRPVLNNKSTTTVVSELEAEVRHLQEELARKESRSSDLETELHDVTAMLEHFKCTYEDLKDQSDAASVMRKQMAAKYGLYDASAAQQAPRAANGVLKPFFTKLCDDPCLQGCCNYFLTDGAILIGSDENSDILLKGVGIGPRMCEVRCGPTGAVVVEVLGKDEPPSGAAPLVTPGRADEDRRVLLNGRRLHRSDGPRSMEHGDCLIIGYAQGFRLVVPTEEMTTRTGNLDACGLARAVATLDLESAVLEITDEEGGQFKETYSYVAQLRARAPESTVQALLHALHCICPLVDEANLITKAVFGRSAPVFRLHSLTDVFNFEQDVPALVVCMLQCRQTVSRMRASGIPDSSGNGTLSMSVGDILGEVHPLATAIGLDSHMTRGGGRDRMLFVWSLEKFLDRLQDFREIYQEHSDSNDGFSAIRKELKAHPLRNPWTEASLSATKLLQEGIGDSSASVRLALSFLNRGGGAGGGSEPATPRNCSAINSPRVSVRGAYDDDALLSSRIPVGPPKWASVPKSDALPTESEKRGAGKTMHLTLPTSLSLGSSRPTIVNVPKLQLGMAEDFNLKGPYRSQVERQPRGRSITKESSESDRDHSRSSGRFPRSALDSRAEMQRTDDSELDDYSGSELLRRHRADHERRGPDGKISFAPQFFLTSKAEEKTDGKIKTIATRDEAQVSTEEAFGNLQGLLDQIATYKASSSNAAATEDPHHKMQLGPSSFLSVNAPLEMADETMMKLQYDLETKSREISHLTAERDKLHDLLQELLERLRVDFYSDWAGGMANGHRVPQQQHPVVAQIAARGVLPQSARPSNRTSLASCSPLAPQPLLRWLAPRVSVSSEQQVSRSVSPPPIPLWVPGLPAAVRSGDASSRPLPPCTSTAGHYVWQAPLMSPAALSNTRRPSSGIASVGLPFPRRPSSTSLAGNLSPRCCAGICGGSAPSAVVEGKVYAIREGEGQPSDQVVGIWQPTKTWSRTHARVPR